jgi:hypothetical protein
MKTKEEIEKAIEIAMYQVWEYTAGDILQMMEECEGRSYAKRDEVIEMVTDAGRTLERLKEKPEVYAYYEKLPYEKVLKIAKRVFTSARYS